MARPGHTRPGDDPFAEPNLLFAGTGGGAFRTVAPGGGTAQPLIATSRAAAFGDLDNDGGIDVVVLNRDAPPHILRNVARRGHWITFRVLEEHGRDAIGATVRITLAGRTVSRDVRTAYSYCAANDPRVHFGLGEQDAVERVEVQWADGSRETFGPFAADRIVALRRTMPPQ